MSNKITVFVQKISNLVDYPKYMTEGSAGMDLEAACEEPMDIAPHSWALVPTGVKMAIPVGYEGQIRPRSGLAAKYGVTMLNSPGTIDSDYRGEIKVILINHSEVNFRVNPKDRVAQIIIAKYTQAELVIVDELDETKRGEGGFGHTGTQ